MGIIGKQHSLNERYPLGKRNATNFRVKGKKSRHGQVN